MSACLMQTTLEKKVSIKIAKIKNDDKWRKCSGSISLNPFFRDHLSAWILHSGIE